ncbi:MAG: VOC family protein [Fibrobacterota bacterium]|nr:VOC family protein [Fibrobacterota bacterium]
MAGKAKPVPDGYHSVTPYITVIGAAEAIEFYKKAFGAVEFFRMPMPDGKVGHAEIQIGDSRIMLSDEFPEMSDAVAKSPKTLGGTSFGLNVFLPDVDAQFKIAIEAGGKERRPVETQFYGDRSGTLEDPFGHIWILSTHVEDISPEEMAKRMESMPQN